MDIIKMAPFVGCGTVKFGMSPSEVEQQLGSGIYWSYSKPLLSDKLSAVRGVYSVYPHRAAALYRIDFLDNQASEISILSPDDLSDIEFQLFGVELFKHPASQVIEELERYESCIWDTDDKDLSYTYSFCNIGFSLLRDGVFHPKLYQDEQYMKEFHAMIPENQEEELKFQYFEVATLRSESLQKRVGSALA